MKFYLSDAHELLDFFGLFYLFRVYSPEIMGDIYVLSKELMWSKGYYELEYTAINNLYWNVECS